jgi:hypothetical protein
MKRTTSKLYCKFREPEVRYNLKQQCLTCNSPIHCKNGRIDFKNTVLASLDKQLQFRKSREARRGIEDETIISS